MCKQAFTLIELSIVLIIIGLLVGGTLVGRDLIKAAELRSFINTASELETARHTFRVKYNCMPGDCAQASQFGLGTSGNGNGSVMIETTDTSASCYVNGSTLGNLTGECQTFWVHLGAAGLIKGDFLEYAGGNLSGDELADYYPKWGKGGYMHLVQYRNKLFIRSGVTAITSTTLYDGISLDGGQMGGLADKMGIILSDYLTACPADQFPSLCDAGVFNQKMLPMGVSILNSRWFVRVTNSCVSGSAWNLEGSCNLLWLIK